MKQKLLIITDWFPPAFKAGGPVQSVYNLAILLKDEFDIYVLTSSTDLEDDIASQLEHLDQFTDKNGISVNYLSRSNISNTNLLEIVRQVQPNTIFVNGLFNKFFSSLLIKLLISAKSEKLIISTRGMLKPSAFGRKIWKKRTYIFLTKLLGIRKKASFHVTSDIEKDEVRRVFGPKAKSAVIPNIPFCQESINQKSTVSTLRLVFAARIHPIKNLHLVLEALKEVDGPVSLDIIGVIDDELYWSKCERLISELGKVNIEYHGSMVHHKLMNKMQDYDVYILPTQGENFGHSIFEALTNGLPVIISDQTPWLNLEADRVGIDVSLEQPVNLTHAINQFCHMTSEELIEWSQNAHQYAANYIANQAYIQSYGKLFLSEKRIGVVAPLPLKRYKGGISVFVENFLKHAKVSFSKEYSFTFINTCVVPRSNESMGKFSIINLKNFLIFLRKSRQTIQKNRIAVLHIHTSIRLSFLKDCIVSWYTKKRCGTKNILHVHFAEDEELQPYRWLTFVYKRILFPSIDKLVVLSPKMLEYFVSIGFPNDKLALLKNFHSYKQIEVADSEVEEVNLLFIGSIDERKGSMDILKALEPLKEYKWKITFAGDFMDDNFKKSFLANIRGFELTEKVELVGYVESQKKDKLLRDSDVLVLPSYGEGMPLSILEAAAMGMAIITTNVGANQEFFSNISNLLTPGDIDSLTEELRDLIANKDLRNKRKKQAKKLSLNFTFAEFKKELEPIYQTI